MGTFGGFEWLIILLIILFFFGARRIPEMARGIGRGMVEFRKAANDDRDEKVSKQEPAPRHEPEAERRGPESPETGADDVKGPTPG